MRTFLVSFDLADPDVNRSRIAAEIMQSARAWARPLDNVWYLRADQSRTEIEARISRHLGGDDGLLIQEARGGAAFLNTGLRWFHQRPTEDATGEPQLAPDNVISFPAPGAPTQADDSAFDEEAMPLRAAS